MSNKQKAKPKRLLSLLLALTMVLGMLPIMGTTTALAYLFNTTNSTLSISINGNKGFLWLANTQRVQCCYNFETLRVPLSGTISLPNAYYDSTLNPTFSANLQAMSEEGKGCYVTDDDTGLVIDHNITDYSLGGSIDIFAKRPRITTQPSGGHSSVMGDAIVLKIDAENANEYTWHIIDEDGKELSWNYLNEKGYASPYVASGGKMLMLRGVSDWMTGKRVYCEVKGYGGTVMSDIVELSVDKVIKYCNDIYFDDFDQIWNHKTVGDFKNPKNDADAPYTIGNVRWEMFSKILSDDFEFESGDNVAVRIDVIPKEGYTFYSSVFGQLNGIDSYATIKNADGSRSIVFTMTITAPDEYKTQNIELSVAEPVAGVKPATTATCTSGYASPEHLRGLLPIQPSRAVPSTQ